jgi:hypothetical protein
LSDFRGSGLLGLKHLWYFSTKDKRADEVFKIASNSNSWYFYAATGINITGKVIQFIEENFCDKYFYDNYDKINLLILTYHLYSEFFVGFNNLWVEKKINDFMKVNSELNNFMEHQAKKIFHDKFVFKNTF